MTAKVGDNLHPDFSDYGFCREDGFPYEWHTPEGWLLCGNEPMEKIQQIEADWREFESSQIAEYLSD